MADAGSTAESSPWAPLRQSTFRLLWPAVVVSYLGLWMQTVGAQWLVVSAPNAGGLVALVQTAALLPLMLLALPAGVLADVFDRRWLLLTVQVYIFIVAGSLAVLTAVGLVTPVLMLVFTFLLGIGAAVQLPTWQAVLPELVPRNQLGTATRLEMVGVNVGRSVGPAIAGVIIAVSGVATVFAVNALSVIFLAVALLRWRRPATVSSTGRERFAPALRAGGRYVWHEPMVRRILLRTVLFVAPGAVLWALLPLLARQVLGLGAGAYGALFGALGLGAIVAALVMGRVRDHLSTNRLLFAAGALFAAVLVVIVLLANFVVSLCLLMFAGVAWTAVVSTLNAELQIFLPVWVRGRALAMYLVTFAGTQALASVAWGQVTERVGVQTTFLIGAGVMVGGVLGGLFLAVPETGHLDREPAVYWSDPRLAVEPEPDTGPVMVAVHYTIPTSSEPAFLDAMEALRSTRQRTGATSWELYRDAEHRDQFVEIFRVPSWEEHLRQHTGRLTVTDRQIEEAALAFSDPPARADHLLPP
ncbi:MAG TPA: MFS transporter [Microlunatus sp.]|nr:MFS transporter [Microlunatus sp.]